MAKENKRAASAARPARRDSPGAPAGGAPSLYLKFETWAQKKERTIFFVLLGLSILLSFITFNTRISEAHDDALYLEGGSRFVNEFPHYFYTQNAPLYPLFLAVLIKLFGFKLILFKVFSLLFSVGG